MSEIITVKNVRGRFNENGFAEINLEDAARGLGFTQVKNGTEYVKWERVKEYLKEFRFSPLVGKTDKNGLPEYIPENIFYKLCFKASNETARKFQDMVTDEVLPSIRKHGMYITPSAAADFLSNPRRLAELLLEFADTQDDLKAERAKTATLETTITVQNQQLLEMKPKVNYYDLVLQSEELLPITIIAKDYGQSACWLNNILNKLGVQYKIGKTWVLYQHHAKMGYTKTKTHAFTHKNGREDTSVHTYWTQKGRLFLYDLLKLHGFLPLIEQAA